MRAYRGMLLLLMLPATARAQTRAARPARTHPDEAVIRARPPIREVLHRDLSAQELQSLPGTRGDALLAVQNLPGVGRPPFGLGAFILRGSDPQDSLVTLELQPIALPFHLYGLATTVATDLIDRIEVVPGNFSVRFGRAAGGVVNVSLRRPASDRAHVTADVDVIDAGVYASTPIGRRTVVAVGARRSYLDGVLALFLPDSAASFVRLPRYWDYQLVVDAQPGDRDEIRVVAAGSSDTLSVRLDRPDPNDPTLRGESGSDTTYHGVQARWRHRFSPSVQHTFAPAMYMTDTTLTLGSDVRYAITTRALSLRDELEVRLDPRWRVFAGVDLQAGVSDASIVAPPLSTDGITDPTGATGVVRYDDSRGFVNPGAYVETSFDTDAVRVQAGLRVDHYARFGATTVDPRVGASWRVSPAVTLRGGFGMYSTPPRGYAVLPGFGNPDLTVERWSHTSAGAAVTVIPDALELTVDGFVKLGDDTVAPSSREVVRDGRSQPERFANTGDARVLGVEVLVRWRPTRWPVYAQLAYTLQRAERRDGAGLPWLPSTYDQPHLLTAIAGVRLPGRWELGVRMRYTSGLPEPRVVGAVYDADHDVSLTRVDVNDPGRLPEFWSLDVRAAKSWRWGPVEMQAILEVLNATNHANVESRIYSFDRRWSVPVTGLPILPTVGLRAVY